MSGFDRSTSQAAARTKQWRLVDEGWGRKAADMATLHEPQNLREYAAVHGRLGVGSGTRLLDIACGAGLAVELASAYGAETAGIDASPRLVAVARDRVPDADLRVGDMRELPWPDETFDVVTSFRGIWGTTPEVLDEVLRVLRPGGRLGLTVWGHLKVSPGAWALAPFLWADTPQVTHQAEMNTLGKPGVGEAVLARHGFEQVERVTVPFAWEFPDPATYARALASTGPAYEAIQQIGEEAFLRDAQGLAEDHVRVGLPLRAEINVTAFLARNPLPPQSGPSYLSEPEILTAPAQAIHDQDVAEVGYVMNSSRLWALDADSFTRIFGILGDAARTAGLSVRDRGILVAATAATLGDSYCALAWGGKLAAAASTELSRGVLTGDDALLDAREQILARWARAVTAHPNASHRVRRRLAPRRGVRRRADPGDHDVRRPADRLRHRERGPRRGAGRPAPGHGARTRAGRCQHQAIGAP